MASSDEIKKFWDSRAGLGKWAGTNDVIAKQIEIEAIAKYVKPGMRVLDIGCGNGITAMEIARRVECSVLGLDYSQPLIDEAREIRKGILDFKGGVRFAVGDVAGESGVFITWDMIYTERMIINLPDWNAQRKAIRDIVSLLNPGGIFVMCENSQNALDRLNDARERIGIGRIAPPWHNRYLLDEELEELEIIGDSYLSVIDCYSSTYYFISRVINAWEAKQRGEEPDYNAPINSIAPFLPPIGDVGQGKIWVWEKSGPKH
jgi:SAM-dependent methyltransferase